MNSTLTVVFLTVPFSVQQLNDALGMNAQRRILGIFLSLQSAYNPATAFECNHLRTFVIREIFPVNNQQQATSTQQLQQERTLGYSFLDFAWGLFLECNPTLFRGGSMEW